MTKSYWGQTLCNTMDHAVLGTVESSETVLKTDASTGQTLPFTRIVLSLVWVSDATKYVTDSLVVEQFGGCHEGLCYSNSAVHNPHVGETWLAFVASEPSLSSPLALGKRGMFRVVTPVGTSIGEADQLMSTSNLYLVTSENSVHVVAAEQAPVGGVSAFAVAQSIVNVCSAIAQ